MWTFRAQLARTRVHLLSRSLLSCKAQIYNWWPSGNTPDQHDDAQYFSDATVNVKYILATFGMSHRIQSQDCPRPERMRDMKAKEKFYHEWLKFVSGIVNYLLVNGKHMTVYVNMNAFLQTSSHFDGVINMPISNQTFLLNNLFLFLNLF